MIIIFMILNSSYKKDITWIAKSVFTLIHIPKMQSSWIESGSVVVNNKKADPNPPQYLLCGWCLSISELRSLIWFSTELTLYICYDSKILAPALLNFCKLVYGSFRQDNWHGICLISEKNRQTIIQRIRSKYQAM